MILRIVDKESFVEAWFFRIIHVFNIFALTLKKAIYCILGSHHLHVNKTWGQGYDNGSNIYTGLKFLILDDCTYAYYI